MIPGYRSRAWRSWEYPESARIPKHGPTIDKPQSKVWRADGSWWALITRAAEAARPELAIHELADGDEPWRDCGSVVTDDPLTSADAHFDGEQLWIVTRAPKVGIALTRWHFNAGARNWEQLGGAWRDRSADTPSVSVAADGFGRVFVAYTANSLPVVASADVTEFPQLTGPTPVPGASATLWSVDLCALVPTATGMGLLWSDQGREAFEFACCHPDGLWDFSTVERGGLVADDHIAVRSHSERLFVAIKTSRDTDPDHTDDEPLISLIVGEPDGRWHRHDVVAVSESVTRPIPLLEPERNLVHVLYTHGPNPGERTIRMKSADMDKLAFPDGPGEVVMSWPGGELNDVTSSRDPLLAATGAVLLASDCVSRRYYSLVIDVVDVAD